MNTLQNVMGQTLDAYNWSYFVTLTTKHRMTLKSARRYATVYTNKIHRKETELNGGAYVPKVASIWFAEEHKQKDSFHLHMLLYSKLSYSSLHALWQLTSGAPKGVNQYCKILNYIKDYGASFYVAKYVVKKASDWDLQFIGCKMDDLIDYEKDFDRLGVVEGKNTLVKKRSVTSKVKSKRQVRQ